MTRMASQKGLLLVVSGPAGVGKGTIDSKLLERHANMVLSVSCTTRAPRPGEIDGVHYSFITEEDFRAMIDRDEFLEYMHVFGMNYYGTPAEPVFRHMSEGRDVLLEIDVRGAMRIKDKYPEALLVFIAPPSMAELKRRLIGRGTETEESIRRRTETAAKELEYLERYDYVVVNDTVDEAVAHMEQILAAERDRTPRNTAFIEELKKECKL